MKRYYHNMSNDTMKFRTWILDVKSIDEADFKWLKAFEIPVRVDAPQHAFDLPNGNTHTVYGKKVYTCDTTTDKQRDMLILKYGNSAVLIQETVVLPGTLSTCTLDHIAW